MDGANGSVDRRFVVLLNPLEKRKKVELNVPLPSQSAAHRAILFGWTRVCVACIYYTGVYRERERESRTFLPAALSYLTFAFCLFPSSSSSFREVGGGNLKRLALAARLFRFSVSSTSALSDRVLSSRLPPPPPHHRLAHAASSSCHHHKHRHESKRKTKLPPLFSRLLLHRKRAHCCTVERTESNPDGFESYIASLSTTLRPESFRLLAINPRARHPPRCRDQCPHRLLRFK